VRLTLERGDRPIGAAICRKAEPPPVRKRRADPSRDGREHLAHVRIDVAPAVELLDIHTKGQGRGHVDRVRGEGVGDVERPAVVGRRREPRVQPLVRRPDHVEEAGKVRSVQRRDGQPALPPPSVALGGEDAVGAQLAENLPHFAPTRELVGACPQDRPDRLWATDGNDRSPADVEPEHGSIPVRPPLD
jgi:hypothetical protein